MNNRIDHATEAREMLNRLNPNMQTSVAAVLVAGAQVHASLALVEQQRIANLIALHRHEVKHDIGSWSRLYDTERNPEAVLKPEIAEGLGIE